MAGPGYWAFASAAWREGLDTGFRMCSAVSVVRIPKIADVPDAQRTAVVVELLEIIQAQQEQMQALKDEITRLKGLKPRPQIRPSKLEDGSRRSGRKGKKRKTKAEPMA